VAVHLNRNVSYPFEELPRLLLETWKQCQNERLCGWSKGLL
jgi:hypothetical protein